MIDVLRKVKNALAMAMFAALAAGCGGGGDSATPPELLPVAPLSIVVIGDSIASGEGIAYGYTYLSDIGFWIGGVTNPQWQGEYQLCHQTPQAYGDVLAKMVDASLAKFACTGSTYVNGILSARSYQGTTYRPAQFGNWFQGTELNAAYDAAKPDVVIVTLGADDVSFADILKYCVLGPSSSEDVAALVQHPERSRILRERVRTHLFGTGASSIPPDAAKATPSDYCTAEKPGALIEQLFWDPVNSGLVAGNYKALVTAIKARGAKAGKVPKIIFTTYHQPLPLPDPSKPACLDAGALANDKLSYLISLENSLKSTLIGAVGGMDGVTVADISGAIAGHEWCTSTPWAYGLTILGVNQNSLAPSHPTADGQLAIANIVKAALPAR